LIPKESKRNPLYQEGTISFKLIRGVSNPPKKTKIKFAQKRNNTSSKQASKIE